MSFCWQCSNLDGHGVTIEIIYGGIETLLSIVRLCRMDVIPNLAFDACESPHQTISYLPKDDERDLESKSYG